MPSGGDASAREPQPQGDRSAAQTFGADPGRYDRARPRYPSALVERIVATAPAGRVLDVGTGTGIAARQFQAAGCQVLGVDPDVRLAEFARGSGVGVEVASFEDWDPAGREFDIVVSGESWHWVDPARGTAKAAEVLRPGGLLALFWNTGQPPPALDAAFHEVYRRNLPQALVARLEPGVMRAAQSALRARTADAIRASERFEEPQEWSCQWTQPYTRDAWLDALQTTGGAVSQSQLPGLLDGVGAAIDAAGGSFTMSYTTFAVTALRRQRS